MGVSVSVCEGEVGVGWGVCVCITVKWRAGVVNCNDQKWHSLRILFLLFSLFVGTLCHM